VISILFMGLAGVVIWVGGAYLFTMLAFGLRYLHRAGFRLGDQAALEYSLPHLGRLDAFFVYFLVPCLNEESVIGGTVARLTAPDSRIIVIDDGSEDATGAVAAQAGGPHVTVLRRDLPDARKGKGEALNAGLNLVRAMAAEAGQDPGSVLVCVMDADGHLSTGAVAQVVREFADPQVGAVQLAVRIRNRGNFLTQIQDFHFWALAAVSQFGRAAIGSVSLGGNGQFSRLTALNEAGQRPWTASLTEDLDLTITMLLGGWKTTTAPGAAVSQQGVRLIKPLVKQRTRWYQGHMACGRRLPEIWRAPSISHARAIELSLYLLVPWVLDLPWSILWHVALLGFIVNTSAYFVTGQGPVAAALSIGLWYLVSFTPALTSSVLQKRRHPETSWPRAILMGHSFLVMNYLFFFCAWKALYALITGKTTWDKTRREHEHPAAEPAQSGASAGSRVTVTRH
jgi:1,2-diacylglycerol 3-beta-glucosyltransferase